MLEVSNALNTLGMLWVAKPRMLQWITSRE